MLDGGRGVLLVTLGYTINANYGNRQDKEAERASRHRRVCYYHGSKTRQFTAITQGCH